MGHSWIYLTHGNFGLEKSICGLGCSPFGSTFAWLTQSAGFTLQHSLMPVMVAHYRNPNAQQMEQGDWGFHNQSWSLHPTSAAFV